MNIDIRQLKREVAVAKSIYLLSRSLCRTVDPDESQTVSGPGRALRPVHWHREMKQMPVSVSEQILRTISFSGHREREDVYLICHTTPIRVALRVYSVYVYSIVYLYVYYLARIPS